jgi:hypothetical protein
MLSANWILYDAKNQLSLSLLGSLIQQTLHVHKSLFQYTLGMENTLLFQ